MLLNALPMAMIPTGQPGIALAFVPVEPGRVPVTEESAIGHAETAAIASGMLGRPVPMNRISVPPMEPGTVHYIAAYQGPRLPEGATELPSGSVLRFYRVTALDIMAEVATARLL